MAKRPDRSFWKRALAPRHPARRRAASLVILLCAQILIAQTASESDVEAAYLFNFAKFMRTPTRSSTVFNIGVMGKNPFGNALDQITAHEQLDGRPMRVVPVTTPEQALACDILFLSPSEAPRIEKDLQMVQGSPVLTVSNTPGFLEHGGMLQFIVVSNRVRFSVNLEAVNRSKISLSSELLKVAASVTGLPPSGGTR